ncbi:MAG: hypothetical protein HC767_05205 [Akkermansiaceae bacterium]|nr:hypothetical protein [Akkermansiaceae bacterium]
MKYAERQGKGFFKAVTGTVTLGFAGVFLMVASKIPWLRKKLPMPGEGPSEAALHGGSFKITLWGLPQQPAEAEASSSNVAGTSRVVASMAVRTCSHVPVP